MENIDNNIIANAKPYKVLLQTSENGVAGGYYDGDEVWHEFGGGGEEPNFNQVKIVNSTNSRVRIPSLEVNSQGFVAYQNPPANWTEIGPSESKYIKYVVTSSSGGIVFDFFNTTDTPKFTRTGGVAGSINVDMMILDSSSALDPYKRYVGHYLMSNATNLEFTLGVVV